LSILLKKTELFTLTFALGLENSSLKGGLALAMLARAI